MIIELALIIIITIVILTEIIKCVMPSIAQQIRGGGSCERFSNNHIYHQAPTQKNKLFKYSKNKSLIFQDTYDENKLFKYDMDKQTRLRYWH
jgi:hypothetical protein